MKLIELYAEEFGCLVDRRFRFGEGFNLIEGPNESGKSTLQALLRFLFYGFPRRVGEEGEERYKRVSRKSRRAAGSVTFSWRGEVYVLSRDYVLHTAAGREMPSETVRATVQKDGSAVDLNGKTPGEYFMLLPAELYHSSVCVRQSEIDGVASLATSDTVGDFLFFGVGGARLETAQKILDEARRNLQHNRGHGGRIPELEAESAALDEALARAREAAERLRVLRNDKARFSITAQDKARELKLTEDMLQAAQLDAQLARYDAWHAAKEEEARLLAAWRESEAAEQIPLPSELLVGAAREALGRYVAACGNAARHAEEVKLAEKEAARHPYRAADTYVSKSGGAVEVAHRAQKFVSGKRGLAVAALLFLLLAIASVPLTVIFEGQFYLILAAGAGALSLSLLCLCLRVGKAKRERAFYAELGLEAPAMLRTFLTRYQQEETVRAAAAANLQNAQTLLAESIAQERAAQTAMQQAFAAIGAAVEDEAEAEAYLAALADRVEAAKAAHMEERMCYERAKSAATALENGLDPAQEAALRAARKALPDPTCGIAELERKRDFLRETGNGIAEKLAAAEREEIAIQAVAEDPTALQARKNEVAGALAAAEKRLAAIKMASGALREADETLRGVVMPALAATASAIFEKLTGGAYRVLHISDRFAVSVETPQGSVPLSHFSAGCRDAAYFALRLGLTELITKEPLPLLLDEVTARLDNTRAAHLLQHLSAFCSAGGQCLFFTCHTREAAFLAGTDFTRVLLG